jgi:hypothetical protein
VRSQFELTSQFTSCCPHQGCRESIEVTDQFSLPSTDGDILHFKIRCGGGHWFTIPVEPGAGAAHLDRAIRTRLDAQPDSLDCSTQDSLGFSILGSEVGAVLRTSTRPRQVTAGGRRG